ncbi:MAG: hypothetical protein QOI49_2659 [Verrucomicrobiota bacterium]|jgi:hypothetical protein
MVVEIRTYQTKPGLRDCFADFITHKSGPVQRSKGIQLLGPFVALDNENAVICLRGFRNLRERHRLRGLFYEDPEWKGVLKAQALEVLDSYKVVLAETRTGTFKFDDYL